MTSPLLNTDDFQGAILGRSGNFLIGWAANSRRSDQVVTVELFGDGVWLATARAGLMLDGLAGELPMPAEANGHGFAFDIRSGAWQAVARFEVYIANHDHRLDGVVFTHGNTLPSLQVLSSHVECRGGLQLTGWAWDALEPATHLKVYAYEGNRLLAETIANRGCIEPELAKVGVDRHAFDLNLPLELADGKIHQIRIVTERGQSVAGSPVTVSVPALGLESWLKTLPLPEADRQLLDALMKQYAWYVPVSAGFSCYQQWHHRFAEPVSLAGSDVPILVAVAGNGDISRTLASLLSQSHKQWKALVCGEFDSASDPRILTVDPSKWHESLRQALGGDYGIVSFVAAGDAITEDALVSIARSFEKPEVQIVYSDCDRISAAGELAEPWFKPDWDPDLFLQSTPLHHLFATRPGNLPVNNPYIGELDAWPWLAVRTVGDDAEAICHIPRVLYHRVEEVSQPVHRAAQLDCDRVLAPELIRQVSGDGNNHLVWADPEQWPLVSLIVPTRDRVELLRSCVESLLKTDYPSLEIIVVDNDSQEPEALAYLDELAASNVTVLRHPGVFNFSAINNQAVGHAGGSLVGLINNDIEVMESGWLKVMVRQLLRPNVGAVGAKLLWPNGMVQHGGVVLGLHGYVGHIGNDWHKDDAGYFRYNRLIRSASAVTAACLLCKREDYLTVGGLDERDFPVNFNDVDFCLKLRGMGKRIVWTPEAQLLHAESASRGKENAEHLRGRLAREKNRLIQKWQHWLMDDPYYSPNLNLDTYSHGGLAVPPRSREKEPMILKRAIGP